MRRYAALAVTGVALAAAGVALADGIGTSAVKSAAATFTATTVASSSTRTCTNADGTFVLTRAEYRGTATSSEPSLNGPITLRILSLINTTKNLGTVGGRIRIDASGRDTAAGFAGVYSGGQVHGLAAGHAGGPPGRLRADVSAGFSAAGGFTNGKIGATDGGGAALLITPGPCEPSQSKAAERAEAHGTITAVSSSSITVAGVTCAVPSSLAAEVAAYKTGDDVTIRCESQSGQLTLVKIKRHGKKK